MNDHSVEAPNWPIQPSDTRRLTEFERDALIISSTKVDGNLVVVSHYRDDFWHLIGFPSNVPANKRQLNFGLVPTAFRAAMKAIIYRYLQRGRSGMGRPKGAAVKNLFTYLSPFLRHLEAIKINHLGAVTPLVCATYAAASKEQRQAGKKSGKPLSPEALNSRFSAVEALYELSQYTNDPMTLHPWRETSALAMAGLTRSRRRAGGKTPLIPDDTFCTLFDHAYQQVERGQYLLDILDALNNLQVRRKGTQNEGTRAAKNMYLSGVGWEGGLNAFNKMLRNLRTACYIVLASTSGCRNHELAYLKSGAHHRSRDDEGSVYHWIRSRSDKTDTGVHDWMIPEAAVRALRVLERWALPYQANIASEIAQRRKANPLDPNIVEASKHRYALFLGVAPRGGQVRTLSATAWNNALKEFAKDFHLTWNLSTHQFRRKFANYAAHSRFGDLRYLKEHYAHWSMDMTLGYAMDDSWGQNLDLELYAEIQGELEDIKLGVIDNWLSNERLTGGFGQALKQWQREPQNLLLFKDHASMLKSISESITIRSNGHAWCTADNGGCVGNTFERTRCGSCSNAVIEPGHAPIYKRLYDDLKGLLHCTDIGEGGRQRVERDLNRCRDVLAQLGIDPRTQIA